jgi:hypothetical protein
MVLMVSLFQNRDMESQYRRVATFFWRMGGWSCFKHPEYVFLHPQLSFALTSHFSYVCLQRLDNGTRFRRTSHYVGFVLMRTRIKQVQPAYNPLVNACIVVNTHEGLVNSIAVLAADIVLLLTMLIGLLRHANKNPSGVWNLLYQQVT